MRIYRDSEGDLWAFTGNGVTFLAVDPEFIWQGPVGKSGEDVERECGPLEELTTEEAVAQHDGLFALFDRLTGLDLPRDW